MKKIKLVIVLLIVFCLAACLSEETENKTLVIVLCDVSNSTTLYESDRSSTGRLDQLKKYVKRVPKWYPVGSVIYYYPVSNNTISDELGKVQYNIITRSQVDPQFAIANEETDKVNIKLEQLARSSPSSCIASSVQRCITRLNELKNSQYQSYELVIISDMLETCYVQMNPLKKEQFKGAIKNFEHAVPSINVAGLNLKVKILINTPGMGNEYEDIKTAWQKWFAQAGITDVQFFTSEPHQFFQPVFNDTL